MLGVGIGRQDCDVEASEDCGILAYAIALTAEDVAFLLCINNCISLNMCNGFVSLSPTVIFFLPIRVSLHKYYFKLVVVV